jgi:hypothetical protein
MKTTCLLAATASTLLARLAGAEVLWDGRFNDLSSAQDLAKWSWGNQVGPYQYYIHGSGAISEYVELSSGHKNPADSGSKQGVKISLTSSAYWNGQNMRRTELIPQTSKPIASGKVFYHFSIKREDKNAPALTREHQIAFFESHFTELKSGWLSGSPGVEDTALRWMVGGQTKWSTVWEAGVWHNVAYEIDFSANTVGFWHSTGSAALERIVAPVGASTSSNGADWHLGVLELPRSGYSDANEDFFFSGVYIENGSITTSVSGPGGAQQPPVSSSSTTKATSIAPSSTVSTVSSTRISSSSAPPAPSTTQPPSGGAEHWAQCGGSAWSGATFCNEPYKCSAINDWYHQCV